LSTAVFCALAGLSGIIFRRPFAVKVWMT
jgi:hypothetical protein